MKHFYSLVSLILIVIMALSLLSGCEKKPDTTGAEATATNVIQTPTALPSTQESTAKPTENKTPEIASGVKTLTFVSINDLHGSIEQDDFGRGGISNTAYLIDTLSKYYGDNDSNTTVRDDIILFGNGDMFQGTAISNMTYGRAVLESMNAMGFDGMGIGNHEFDWGLDKIAVYWDGNADNGEAYFPLVSSNIHCKNKNTLYADVSSSDNIQSGIIVEKEGVKIGLISVIGPCENSILQEMVADYSFDDVVSSVEKTALELKNKGAELISVNIHYGVSGNDPMQYDVNTSIASLKDTSGDYLVDIIFNGHTHYKQYGIVQREDGSSVPVIQAGANNDAIGMVTLMYDIDSDTVTVTKSGTLNVSSVGVSQSSAVQKVVNYYVDQTSSLRGELAISSVTINGKSSFYNYVADIMVNAIGSDYSTSNQGGIRSTGEITKGSSITADMLYSVIPFDNVIYLVTIKGSALYNYYESEQDFNYFGKSDSTPDWSSLKNSNEYYELAIIDYVYTGNYFNYDFYITSELNTGLVLRDLLIKDVKLFGDAGESWTPYNGSKIECCLVKSAA